METEIELLEQSIFCEKNYLMNLLKRLVYVRADYSLKSNYEKNEVEIITYQTKKMIVKKNKQILELEERLKMAIVNKKLVAL